MILDGRKGWYWVLKELPKIAKGMHLRFNVVERQIGDRFNPNLFSPMDDNTLAFDVSDSDTLLGILFDESIKFKCIAAISVQKELHAEIDEVIGLNITIVLVQGVEHTNIDSDVMDGFARCFNNPHGQQQWALPTPLTSDQQI